MIEIVLNGERKSVADGLSLADLCNELALPERGVAVAVNFELIPKSGAAKVQLRNNDIVEIVTATAGG